MKKAALVIMIVVVLVLVNVVPAFADPKCEVIPGQENCGKWSGPVDDWGAWMGLTAPWIAEADHPSNGVKFGPLWPYFHGCGKAGWCQ